MSKRKRPPSRSRLPSKHPGVTDSPTPQAVGKPHRENAGGLGEDRRSLAVTVAWMMTSLATVAALAFWALAAGLRQVANPSPDGTQPLSAVPELLLFTSLVTGCLAVLLIPVVYRVRSVPPPQSVTWVVVTVAAIPWLVLFLWASR